MKLLDEQLDTANREKYRKTNQTEAKKNHQCRGCGAQVDKLYQQNLCRQCLSAAFKRLIKVIDSVRK